MDRNKKKDYIKRIIMIVSIGLLLVATFVLSSLLNHRYKEYQDKEELLKQILIVKHSCDSVYVTLLDTTETILYSALSDTMLREKWIKIR